MVHELRSDEILLRLLAPKVTKFSAGRESSIRRASAGAGTGGAGHGVPVADRARAVGHAGCGVSLARSFFAAVVALFFGLGRIAACPVVGILVVTVPPAG